MGKIGGRTLKTSEPVVVALFALGHNRPSAKQERHVATCLRATVHCRLQHERGGQLLLLWDSATLVKRPPILRKRVRISCVAADVEPAVGRGHIFFPKIHLAAL